MIAAAEPPPAARNARRSLVKAAVVLALACAAVPLPAEVPSPPEAPAPLDRLALVGLWTDDGDCADVTELRLDGTFVAPNGTRGGWELRGSTLVLFGPGGVVSWTIALDPPDTMTLTASDGSVSRSLRCPALPAPVPNLTASDRLWQRAPSPAAPTRPSRGFS